MPEVQNVGAVDYAQYQPSQYVDNNYVEEYNTQPEVYDENAEQMRTASKSRLGATILGLAVVGGLGFWGGHVMGKKSAKDAAAVYDQAKKALEGLNEEADKVINTKFGGFQFGKDFAKKVKEALNKIFPKADEAKDKTTKTAEEVIDKAKDKAKEAADKVADTKK